MEEFREVLQDLIWETGLSVHQIAAASGVSSAVYSYYLNGRTPTLPVALKIARYFKCSLDYLCGLDDRRCPSPYATDHYDRQRFLRNYRQLLVANHLTHYQFAKTTQAFNESIIRHWQAGKMPRLDLLYTIARHLHGSIDELVGRE